MRTSLIKSKSLRLSSHQPSRIKQNLVPLSDQQWTLVHWPAGRMLQQMHISP